jgi:hypothetical protein
MVRVLGLPYLFQKSNNKISLKIVALRWKKSFTSFEDCETAMLELKKKFFFFFPELKNLFESLYHG